MVGGREELREPKVEERPSHLSRIECQPPGIVGLIALRRIVCSPIVRERTRVAANRHYLCGIDLPAGTVEGESHVSDVVTLNPEVVRISVGVNWHAKVPCIGEADLAGRAKGDCDPKRPCDSGRERIYRVDAQGGAADCSVSCQARVVPLEAVVAE